MSLNPELYEQFTATSQEWELYVRSQQARRDGGIIHVAVQAGEAHRFDALARSRHTSLPALVRTLLLQEYYRGQRLAVGADDEALAQAVAQARGMRHAHTLLRPLLYNEAWRLGIEPRGKPPVQQGRSWCYD